MRLFIPNYHESLLKTDGPRCIPMSDLVRRGIVIKINTYITYIAYLLA